MEEKNSLRQGNGWAEPRVEYVQRSEQKSRIRSGCVPPVGPRGRSGAGEAIGETQTWRENLEGLYFLRPQKASYCFRVVQGTSTFKKTDYQVPSLRGKRYICPLPTTLELLLTVQSHGTSEAESLGTLRTLNMLVWHWDLKQTPEFPVCMLSLTWQFLEAEPKKMIWLCITICTLRSVPLPFPTPEGNKVRLIRTKSKMSHRLTLWIKEKIMAADSVSIVNLLGLTWIPSLKDKAVSPTLSPKAQFIRLEGEKKDI